MVEEFIPKKSFNKIFADWLEYYFDLCGEPYCPVSSSLSGISICRLPEDNPDGPTLPASQRLIIEWISDSPISVVTPSNDVAFLLLFQKPHLLDFVVRALSSTPSTPSSTVTIAHAARFRGDTTGATFSDNDPRLTSTGNFTGVELLITGLTFDPTIFFLCGSDSSSVLRFSPSFVQQVSHWIPTQVHKPTHFNLVERSNISAQSSPTLIPSSLSLVRPPTSTVPLATTTGPSICNVERTPCITVIVFAGDVSVSSISTVLGHTSVEIIGACWLLPVSSSSCNWVLLCKLRKLMKMRGILPTNSLIFHQSSVPETGFFISNLNCGF